MCLQPRDLFCFLYLVLAWRYLNASIQLIPNSMTMNHFIRDYRPGKKIKEGLSEELRKHSTTV